MHIPGMLSYSAVRMSSGACMRCRHSNAIPPVAGSAAWSGACMRAAAWRSRTLCKVACCCVMPAAATHMCAWSSCMQVTGLVPHGFTQLVAGLACCSAAAHNVRRFACLCCDMVCCVTVPLPCYTRRGEPRCAANRNHLCCVTVRALCGCSAACTGIYIPHRCVQGVWTVHVS
jgi:hypothetical protein